MRPISAAPRPIDMLEGRNDRGMAGPERGWVAAGLAALVLLLALASVAAAQAPQRSPQPLARPAGLGTLAGISADPAGTLRRTPADAPPTATDTHLPQSMQPHRPDLVVTGPTSVPVTALRPPPARPMAPSPAPDAIAAALALAAALPAATPPVSVSPPASVSPLAPARSLRPPSRSTDALRRFARLQGQAQAHAQAGAAQPTPAAAGGTSRADTRSRGGLCGVAAIEGRQLAPITSSVSGCGIAEPVSVTAIGGIRLSQPATLDCDTARAFERWVRQSMLPAFGRRGGGVAQIRIAAHYSCRPRNNRAGARISEHGRGRAIDVSGFRMANGDSVSILQDWRRGPYRQALRQMHRAACGTFRTTLGPGSDGFHEDHFHYDLARHRSGTYCR
ncbi:MAG: extensin family protein [Pararhodobacter sp.]